MSRSRDIADSGQKINFLDNVVEDLNTAFPPAGMIASFGMSSAPTGWLVCDGSAVSRSTYSDLHTAIGTTWGSGDGNTTFNLPDLEGAFLRGTGSHGTSNMADGNDFAGPAVGSFEDDQFQGHKHDMERYNFREGSGSLYNILTETDAISAQTKLPIADGTNGTPRTGDETRPFNAGVKYCIKY